jgi:lipoprotein signal peptidase
VYVRVWHDFHWPAFNVADSAMVVGIIILACSLLLLSEEKEKGA